MNKWRRIIPLSVLTLITVGLLWSGEIEQAFGISDTTQSPTSAQRELSGVPAIQPKMSATNVNTPTFSKQEVLDYISSHPKVIKAKTDGPMMVAAVEFLSPREVDQRINRSTGIQQDRLLCLVTFQGTFIAIAPTETTGINTSSYYYLIFDAHSGNMLGTGPGERHG